MAFEAIAVRQSKAFTVTGEDTSVAATLDSAVAAGSTLVIIGTEASTDGLVAILSSVSDTSTNTWGTPTNTRTAGAYAPNTFACVAENVASGSPTVTMTFGGSDGNTNKVSFTLIEVENPVTSSGVDKLVTGTASGSTSTSTSATGALTQTDNLVILAAGGWFGTPSNPSGWTNIQSVMNGAYMGSLVCHKTVTATDSITGTVAHEAAAATSAIMLVIKAATAGSALQYTFTFDTSTFTSADTGITGYVWRNATPDQAAAQRFTGLAGDATAGTLHITDDLPSGLSVSDTIYGIFYNGTDTSGLVSGTVEST